MTHYKESNSSFGHWRWMMENREEISKDYENNQIEIKFH